MMRMCRFSAFMVDRHRRDSIVRLRTDAGKSNRRTAACFHSRKAKKSPLSVWAGHWKRDADDERTASLFVASAEFPSVRLDDRAGAIQPETVMALPESE